MHALGLDFGLEVGLIVTSTRPGVRLAGSDRRGQGGDGVPNVAVP